MQTLHPFFALVMMVASVTAYPYPWDFESEATSGDGEFLYAKDSLSGDGEIGGNLSGDGEIGGNLSGDGEIDDNVSGSGEMDDNLSGSGEMDDNFSGNDPVLIVGEGAFLNGDGDGGNSYSIPHKNVLIEHSDNFVPPQTKETIVFIKKISETNHLLYIRGGNPNAKGCTDSKEPKNDPCAIPITNVFLGLNADSYARDGQSEGDLYLSWAPREDGQPKAAKGTPAIWTTNNTDHRNFSPLNKFGPDYWMARFEMDCSAAYNGFFEVKGYYKDHIETDVASSTCSGDEAAAPPIQSSRGGHLARCGYINVLTWGRSDCQVLHIPPE